MTIESPPILMANPPVLHRRCWLYGAVAALCAGCEPGTIRAEKRMDPAMERLLAVSRAYGEFTHDRGWPPNGPDDIRPLLQTADSLVSPRDGEPFVVFWGVDLRAPQGWAVRRAVLAHERLGVEGCRYALSLMGNVELLDEEEFRGSSFPPPRKKP